ncbi:MAG: 6-carboxytetrahydropterin synthase QueD [Treponema sp.]|uniref:6-carboxytetrahydropterin synthase QueD n=1 Tax=Treponema sp. TaxID=166 RepID=UPI00298DF217|nr:6-carboxytetrahydropterin synthase QueD [Treponema sp.]MBR5932571.1 6-carboxytetrahydropterin synthase QueD [Treponema sp.]
MYKVRIEDSFAAAHFLRDYHGKCENLHGHNYKVYVYLKGENLTEGGMLYDFAELKKDLKSVLDVIDHTNLNDLTENGKSVFEQNPSAERIAKYIFDKLAAMSEQLKKLLYRVDVFETEKNRASYEI